MAALAGITDQAFCDIFGTTFQVGEATFPGPAIPDLQTVTDADDDDLAGQLVTSVQGGVVTTYTYDANGNQTNQQLPTQRTTMSYDKENRMATFAEDATLNTYTYDSDGFEQIIDVV